LLLATDEERELEAAAIRRRETRLRDRKHSS
jgi:hypothetical protein